MLIICTFYRCRCLERNSNATTSKVCNCCLPWGMHSRDTDVYLFSNSSGGCEQIGGHRMQSRFLGL